MLTKVVLDRCQQVLKSQYKMRYGLQDSALGQKLILKEERGEFVQILHNGSYHWVVVSNINSTKNEINH